ncbi:PBSX family phage terminase large subunit [Brevibacillus halotolerans]|uniref:PBSX family phage terminase large subunit n=1 Tax=Brevibacillus TaxID=55080 RepID=UPI00215C1D2D|nr:MULTISPECIES: PBSX family phage terminase large subunit [Brevibacillus]MCR8961650.1 PBSX family phage terminase large subunit [Brevibacillus laterosporus]MCZ0833805.1 PBSX family phage terminase large subunit [Brevibacillus halotolerans]
MFEFKPFSRKQLDVICNADAFINILEGSVRSGKTIASIVAWIDFIKNSPHRKFLMTGSTSDTLYRNVIEDIERILGKKRARYVKSAKGGARLTLKFENPAYPDESKQKYIYKICYCVGSHDERAEGRIRGMTVAGWYADEVTLYPESVVKQAINRMSLTGARAIWTTNPDSPYHYVKKDFIEKAADKGFKTWHFVLDDNFALDETYKKNIRNTYVGLWYKRMILGLWVQAEGAIYDMWDEKLNTFSDDDLIPGFKSLAQRYITIDVGTKNATVFLDCWDDGDTVWIVDEYYYNGRDSGRQKENSEYANDLEKFIGDEYPRAIILDPSAASFKTTLRNRGLRIKDADNEVLEGIRVTSTMIAKRKIRVHRTRCRNFLEEINGYVWDEKVSLRGIEQPLKRADHCMDAIRYFVKTIIKPRRLLG